MLTFKFYAQDWNYLHTNDFEITLELGCYKYPPHAQLSQYWEDNREALVTFIERVHMGIKGFVLDETTGEPISGTNATIEVDEIHHGVVSGPSGDYFRLLVPGGTYTVSAVADGYERSVQKVHVPNALVNPDTEMFSAKVVNFTLAADQSKEWSKVFDYGIADNLKSKYLSNDEMRSEMAELENAFPDLIEVMMNEAYWSTEVPAIFMRSNEDQGNDEKINLALFGSLYGSQPLGRELLIRLARHLGYGFRKQDPKILRLFRSVNIYIFPMVDSDFFDPVNDGDCSYDVDESLNREVGAKFRRAPLFPRGVPDKVVATKHFLNTHEINIALSVEGEGLFVRLPYDDKSLQTQRPITPSAEKDLMVLASAFKDAHPAMNGSKAANPDLCDNKPTGVLSGSQIGKYHGSLLDYGFSQGISIISVHVTCCNFPNAREVPNMWKDNLPPLLAFLEAASQGLYGMPSNLQGKALTSTEVSVDGQALELQNNSGFMALLAEGNHVLSFKLKGYESKVVDVNIKAGEMVRQNVVMDLAVDEERKYHTSSQVGMLMNQLTANYPGKARVYPIGDTAGRVPLLVVEVSEDLETSHLKPAIKVLHIHCISWHMFDG